MPGEIFVGVKSLLTYNRKTLLINHVEERDAHGGWEYPGGAMIFGETPQETLIREVREETGLEIEIRKLLFAVTVMVGERQCVGLTYLSRAKGDIVTLSEEHTDYRWVNRRQLVEMLNEKMLGYLIDNAVLDLLEID